MKNKLLLTLALISTWLTGFSAAYAQTAKTQAVNDAVLYKITGKNLKKPSYLFGTFHLLCEKDLFSPAIVKSYVAQTEKLMLEIDMTDPAQIKSATEGSMLENGKTAKDYLKPEDYAKVDALYKNYLGMSYDNLQTFRPVITATLLMMSPKVIGCKAVPGFDKILADTAKENKMPVVGLETIADQMNAINSKPLETQFAELVKFADDPNKAVADFQNLYKAYLSQNSDDAYKIVEEQMKTEADSKAKMLDDRNAKWIPVIEQNIQNSSAFIAVGDGHLGGEKGILKLLRDKGYTLTPIRIP